MSAEHTAAFKHLPNTKNKSHLMRLTMNCIRGLHGFPLVTTIFPNTIPIVYTYLHRKSLKSQICCHQFDSPFTYGLNQILCM